MTDNDPAVDKRYIVLDEFYDASSGRVHDHPPDLCPGESRALLVPCDADGNVTPEGARALFPELAAAVDRHSAAVAVLQAAGLGMRDNDATIAAVTDEATRVFTAPDRQENPELDSGSQG